MADLGRSGTALSPELRRAGAVFRNGNRVSFTRALPVDVEIMQFLLRFKYARAIQVAGWLGCSGTTAYRRLTFLKNQGYVESDKYAAYLRPWGDLSADATGRIVTVWRVKDTGRSTLDPWQVPGDDLGVCVLPKASRFSKTMADHTLGVVDLGVWYKRYGYEVTSEREVKQVEMPGRAQGVVKSPVWCPKDASALHAPDLGVIDPRRGVKWGVELERALKPEAEYRKVIRAYSNAGMGQVWHVSRKATLKNLINAAGDVGFTMRMAKFNGVQMFSDQESQLIRFRLWQPGFVEPRSRAQFPKMWEWLSGGGDPLGLGVPQVDVSKSWRIR